VYFLTERRLVDKSYERTEAILARGFQNIVLFGVRAMSLSSFDAGVSSALVVEALRRDGAAIVRNLASATLVDAVTAELRVKLDESGADHQAGYPTGFSGRKTLRC